MAGLLPPRLREVVRASTSPFAAVAAAARRWRRLAAAVAVLAAVFTATFSVLISVAAITAPVAIPLLIAGRVLSETGDLLDAVSSDEDAAGSTADIIAEAEEHPIACRPVPDAQAGPAPSAAESVPGSPFEIPDSVADPVDVVVLAPLRVERDGSLTRHDASLLVDPLSPNTSALTAHVWFLYRLAGMGDWDAFTSQYAAAGLRGDSESDNAPLEQIQALNRRGVDLERYRLTAAALVVAAMRTGRIEAPYPQYRQLAGNELTRSCLDEADAGPPRMEFPAPSVTSEPAEGLETADAAAEPQAP